MGRRKQNEKSSWGELVLFVMIIIGIYFILALFDSSLSGDGGREWGKYLRDTWGGAVIVILLFWIYVCIAGFVKFRIPKFPRQLLGTLQLYISFAFLLGFLKNSGWNSEWTIFTSGSFGYGLARFFVLNTGSLGTFILIAGSFLLSAYLFGSKILNLSLPSFNFPFMKNIFKNQEQKTESRRRSRKNRKSYEERTHEKFFPPILPEPEFKTEPDPLISILSTGAKFNTQTQTDSIHKQENKNNSEKNAIDILDNLLSSIEAGEFSAPSKKRINNLSSNSSRKRNRRPFPDVQTFPETQTDLDEWKNKFNNILPPPMDIFGPEINFQKNKKISSSIEEQGEKITSTLKNFGIEATTENIISGPSTIQFQLKPSPGTKLNEISKLTDELMMTLAVTSVRIETPIPGTHYAGIEIPNPERKIIPLRIILDSYEFKNSKSRLSLPIGMNINSEIFVRGLEEMPHILVTGNSSSGKTVFLNSCIIGMCSKRTPNELKLILIDPKKMEFAIYDNLPHLLSRPITEQRDSIDALEWVINEIENRAEIFAESRVRNIASYNRKVSKRDNLPEIAIIIDEISDLIHSSRSIKDIKSLITRIARKSGASGIYLIIATQKSSDEFIINEAKTDFPAQAVFMLSSSEDSKNILGIGGAENLTGKGDMLFKSSAHPQPLRIQTPFVTEEQITDFTEYMQSVFGLPEFINFRN